MKLLRYGAGGRREARPSRRGRRRSATSAASSATSPARRCPTRGSRKLRALDPSDLPMVDGTPRLGPCVAGTGKFICIGLNYADHAAESGLAGAARAGDLHEGDLRDLRPERRRSDPARRPRRPTGRSSSASSSARRRNTSPRPTRWTTSRATAWSTTSPSARSRPSAPASGPRASRATPSARRARGS